MKNRITLLHITHAIDMTDRIVVNLCKSRDTRFFDAKMMAYGGLGGKEHDFETIHVELVVAHHNLDVIADTIRRWQPDAIHFMGDGDSVPFQYDIFACARSINPQIVILETNYFSKFSAQSYPFIDCSLQVSKMMLNERYVPLVGQFDFNRTKIVYHPIDCVGWDAVPVTDTDVAAFKHKLGIQSGDFVIGKLSRPVIEKWSDLLLDMMPYLVRLVPRVKFIIQEMPESRKRIVAKSPYRDHFILLNKTNDNTEVALFFKTIDVYAHASKIGESFGMTLAEAGVFRRPVVINSTPDRDNNQLELVEHMKTGIIANYPQTFARAIAYLAHSPTIRIAMGNAAREKVERTYNPTRITEQMEKIVVEKMVQKGIALDPALVKRYSDVPYVPSEAEIRAYQTEYQVRLREEYGTLSVLERFVNRLRAPKKFFYKLRDFIEHKLSQRRK